LPRLPACWRSRSSRLARGTRIKQGGDHTYYSVAWNDTFSQGAAGAAASPAASGGGRSVLFAGPGYNLVDGVGTVNAAYLVYELARKPVPAAK
jgi:hypothetical protein